MVDASDGDTRRSAPGWCSDSATVASTRPSNRARTTVADSLVDHTPRWTTRLDPHRTWTARVEWHRHAGDEGADPGVSVAEVSIPTPSRRGGSASLAGVAPGGCTPDHAGLGEAVRQAGEDLGASRIFDPEHPDVPILAAGVPWFMTVFAATLCSAAWDDTARRPALARGVPRRWPASRVSR